MPLSTHVHEARLRVRYAETDALGIAHHSAFVVWLEAGRVEWMRSVGPSYAELEARGYALPVIELRLRFVSPARFDDEIVVRTALSDLRSRSARFSYEIVTAARHPVQLANGMTRHVCLRHGEVSRVPAELRRLADSRHA